MNKNMFRQRVRNLAGGTNEAPALRSSEQAKGDRDAIMTGLYLGVWFATLLALVCAIVGLALHPAQWVAAYWWGIIDWAAIWIGLWTFLRIFNRAVSISFGHRSLGWLTIGPRGLRGTLDTGIPGVYLTEKTTWARIRRAQRRHQ